MSIINIQIFAAGASCVPPFHKSCIRPWWAYLLPDLDPKTFDVGTITLNKDAASIPKSNLGLWSYIQGF